MKQLLTLLTVLLVFPVALADQKLFLKRFLALTTVANIRGFKLIAMALCFGITICLAGIANAETVTYSWTGTIVGVGADDGTGIYTGTQVGDTFSGTFTYDPDEANITGLHTSDGDLVIEPSDVWVEYHLGSSSAVLTDGTTELIWPGATLSISTDYVLDEQDELDWFDSYYDLFGIELTVGALTDGWGLDFGDGIFEFEVTYGSLVNMQDDLSFRPNPPWSPPASPDDPDNQIATFEIQEYSDYDQEELIYVAIGVINGIEVLVDIKPDSDPNSINLCSNGTIPIAVLGSDTFDVYSVNTENLRFSEASVKVVGKKDPHSLCNYEDVNDDTFYDLVCHFLTADIAGTDGQSSTATVNGELFNGAPFEGTDSVNIVKDTCD
jgi:hypothetical protein